MVQQTEPFFSFCHTYGKQKRSSAPKVRTGCRQCKTAHVKCNEQKPSCGRCQRSQTKCIYPKASNREPGQSKYPAVPGEQQFRVVLAADCAKRTTHLMEPSASFMRPRERRYFDNYRRNVIFQLGYGESEFWCRTVLRECARNDCIRNAIVALGALARAQRQQDQETRTSSKIGMRPVPLYKSQLTQHKVSHLGLGDSSSDHYYHALEHYTKAVGSFRRLIQAQSNRREATWTILIATILLVNFESLQGNTQSADQLGAGTLTILRDSIMQGSLKSSTDGKGSKGSKKNEASSTTPPIAASVDDDGVREAEAFLVRSICLNACLSPVHPKTREIFVQLPVPTTFGPTPPSISENITVFSRAWANALVLFCLWYMQVQSAMLNAHDDRQKTAGLLNQYLQERPKCLRALALWQTAASQRLALATTECEPVENVLTYNKINLTIKTTYYSLCTVFDLSGKLWGRYMHAMSQILKQSEAVVEQEQCQTQQISQNRDVPAGEDIPKTNTLRNTDMMHEGVMPVLAQVVREAPRADLRRRAMEALGRMVTSQSHWDVQGAYLSMKAQFELEERYRDPMSGFIPTKAQLYAREAGWNEDYSEFRTVFVAKEPGPDGVFWKEAVVMPAVS